MTIGTLFTLFVTPTMYTFLARDHQKAKAKSEAARSGEGVALTSEKPPSKEELEELDAAAEAGVLFPAEPEDAPTNDEVPTAPKVAEQPQSSSSVKRRPRKPQRRPSRRKDLPTAAE
jgi:hypothetical protein